MSDLRATLGGLFVAMLIAFLLGFGTHKYVVAPATETVVSDTVWLPTPAPPPILVEGPAVRDTVYQEDTATVAAIERLADSLRSDNTALVAKLQEKRFSSRFDTAGVQGSVSVSYRPLDEWFRVGVNIEKLPPTPSVTTTITRREPAWVKPLLFASTVGAVLFAQDKQYLPAAACATVAGITLTVEL